MIIIDATNLIVGRFATFAAKQALLGEEIAIVNCEKAFITGSKEHILNEYKRKRSIGTWATGPFYHRQPDRLVRRMIRGMLPHKQP
ncbi:uL13 family ribosomal protein [Candidatus Woesearchaeota archaeon]|nr:uL13 family ribosomal protein [Candidatus Woesearchaeota archaeon]